MEGLEAVERREPTAVFSAQARNFVVAAHAN